MLRQCEQRLERGKETPSHCAGATGMVAEAHRKRNWSPAWNRRRISEDGRNRRALSGRLGTTATGSIGIKTGNGVTPDSASVSGAKPANEVPPDLDADSKPANEVIPDSGASAPKQTTAASASEPYRELIEQALNRGRNA